MEDSKTLYTEKGEPIEWLSKSVDNHLDKTTLIFGGTNSGKTTLIEEILYLLKDEIPNVLVIAPKTSDSAYRKKLPARCIKEDLSKDKLQKIWARQVNATQIYATANDINVLESLFRLAPVRESTVMIEAIKRSATNMVKIVEASKLDHAKKKSQVNAINELQFTKIKKIYKDAIAKHKHIFERMMETLSTHQKTAIEYLDFNPRFLLIIDDSTEKFQVWMKYFKKGEVNPVESIFYKNRHNFLTLVIAAHDDKYINTEFRKNSRLTIYTTSQSLITSADRKANGFTPKEKKSVSGYATRIFGTEDLLRGGLTIKTHQKLVYVRDDTNPFKYTIANTYPDFYMCCNPTRKLASSMPAKDNNLEANPFVKRLDKK